MKKILFSLLVMCVLLSMGVMAYERGSLRGEVVLIEQDYPAKLISVIDSNFRMYYSIVEDEGETVFYAQGGLTASFHEGPIVNRWSIKWDSRNADTTLYYNYPYYMFFKTTAEVMKGPHMTHEELYVRYYPRSNTVNVRLYGYPMTSFNVVLD